MQSERKRHTNIEAVRKSANTKSINLERKMETTTGARFGAEMAGLTESQILPQI